MATHHRNRVWAFLNRPLTSARTDRMLGIVGKTFNVITGVPIVLSLVFLFFGALGLMFALGFLTCFFLLLVWAVFQRRTCPVKPSCDPSMATGRDNPDIKFN